MFEVTVRGSVEEMHLDAEGFTLDVAPKQAKLLAPHLGKQLTFGIRPENIHDSDFRPADIKGCPVEATVDVTELMGNEVFLYLATDSREFLARVDPRTKCRPGHKVQVIFDMDQMHAFDPETEAACC